MKSLMKNFENNSMIHIQYFGNKGLLRVMLLSEDKAILSDDSCILPGIMSGDIVKTYFIFNGNIWKHIWWLSNVKFDISGLSINSIQVFNNSDGSDIANLLGLSDFKKYVLPLDELIIEADLKHDQICEKPDVVFYNFDRLSELNESEYTIDTEYRQPYQIKYVIGDDESEECLSLIRFNGYEMKNDSISKRYVLKSKIKEA